MKVIKLTLIVATSLLTLSACTNTPEECDPSIELNVFSKAACKMSGSYDKRIEQKEKVLIDEKATNKELNAIYAQIQQQQKTVNALTANLKQKAAGKSGLLKQIAEVEQQMQAVNNSTGSEMDKQLEIQRLQSKLSTLQQALGL